MKKAQCSSSTRQAIGSPYGASLASSSCALPKGGWRQSVKREATSCAAWPPHATREQREAVIEGWYRTLLARAIPAVLARCEQVVGKRVKEWHIRKMKTRWGTCNVIAARIWLSLALVKHAPEALEYVVTHELTHLWVRNHGSAFKAHMDIYYPDWRRVKKELNRG